MKTRTWALTFALLLFAGAVCLAEDVQMGTWKLNESKSTLAAGFPHNNTVVYEAAGDGMKVTIEGTASVTSPTNGTWNLKATDLVANKTVFEASGLPANQPKWFSYKTGFRTQLKVVADWPRRM